MSPCPGLADRLTEELGGFTCGPPVLSLRNPADLTNWTLPVLELLMVAGAVTALIHVTRRRDPVLGSVIGASLVYLVVVEPVLYFPPDDDYLLFVHNVFTVDLLYDRLPLYIVALYVVLPVTAFQIVRTTGVLDRRGPLVGAICVGAVHSCLYEAFDQIGPHLRWWAWNPDAPANQPFVHGVPLASVTLFSAVAPAALAYFTVRLPPRWWRPFAVGVLTPLAMVVAGLPAVGPVKGAVYWLELLVMAGVAVFALAQTYREKKGFAVPPGVLVRWFAPAYLVVMAVFWVTA